MTNNRPRREVFRLPKATERPYPHDARKPERIDPPVSPADIDDFDYRRRRYDSVEVIIVGALFALAGVTGVATAVNIIYGLLVWF